MTAFAELDLVARTDGLLKGEAGLVSLAKTGAQTEANVTASMGGIGRSAELMAAVVKAASSAESIARIAASQEAQSAADRVVAAAQGRLKAEQAAAEAIARAARQESAAREAAAYSYSSLRASLDPLYAASMQYERAVETVNAAVKAQIVTQEQANRVLGMAEQQMLGVTPAVQKVAMSVDDVGKKSGFAAGGGMRMLGQQLSQVAQQGSITGNYLGALAVQLPDIALGFGSVAVAASIVATVALPAIMAAMGNGKSATDLAADANEAYASSFALVSQDMEAAAALDAAYTAAVLSGSTQRIEAIRKEAAIRLLQLKIDITDQATEAAAALAAQNVAQQAVTAATLAQADAQLILNQSRATGQQIEDQLAAEYALKQATAELEAQQRLYEKTSVAYQLIGAQIDSNKSKMADTERLLENIADGTAYVASGLVNAANAAYGLANAIMTAGGYMSNLRSMIDGISFSNVAMAASNAALMAGSTAAAATAAGQLAEQRAKLAPLLDSEDAIVRNLARSQVTQYEAALQTNVALNEQHGALIKTANAASGAGKATKSAMDEAGKAAKKAAKDAADAAKDYVETMQGFVKSGIDGFIDQMLDGFSGGMKSLKDLLVNTIKSMISFALKNKIMLAIGMGGVPGAAIASASANAAASPAGGALSGIAGVFSNALGSFGSSGSIFGAAGLGGGSGFLGGLGSSISSGIGGIFNVSANIAAAGGGLAATLGALVAPLAAVAAVFSFFKTKTTQLDAGLRLTVNGLETAVETFSRVKRTKFWGLSSSTRTTYAAASDSVADPISRAIGEMQSGIIETAGILGIGSAAFNTFAKQLQISTQGLSESDALAAVQKAILGLGDDFASLATGIGDFTRDGEGAMAALTRLSQALTAVNLMADTLGMTFRAVGLIGADMASQLADTFGGLDALNTAVGNYYAKFYTEAERNATATRQAAEALAKLNASMPRSRDEYRAMVEAQDLTTESGRALFAALVSMSGVMDQVLPQVGTFTAAIAAIVGNVQTGLGAMITATQDAQSKALAAAEAWRDTAKTLRRYIGDMRGRTSALTSASAALVFNEAQFRALLAQALGGNLEAAGQLTGAADALISSAGENATTTQEAARAQAAVLAGLTQVADSADTTGTAMDALAALLGEQLTILQTISDYLAAGGVDATHIQGLTDSLAALQGPIAGVGALDLTAQLAAPMATLGAGLASLVFAIQDDIKDRAARAAADASARTAAQVEAARLAALAEADRLAAVAAAEAATAAAEREAARLAAIAASQSAYQSWFAQGNEGPVPHGWGTVIAGFAGGGDHKGGLRIVGEDGAELEATGPSRIFTAAQTKAMLKGGNSTGGFAEVVSELRSLRRQVEGLQEQERQMQAQILSDGRRERKIIEAWEATGMPPARAAL